MNIISKHGVRRPSRIALSVVAVLAAGILASGVTWAAAAAAPTALPAPGTPTGAQPQGADPPLTPFATVPLSTAGGTIQTVIYDGANTEATGGSLTQALSGFTVPASLFTAKTTAIVADGQVPGNSFSFTDTSTFTDSNAFPGKGPSPSCSSWSYGCLWDTNNYDVSSDLSPGDTSASATVATPADCVTWVAQAFATGPSAAFTNAGYVAAGVALRDQKLGDDRDQRHPLGRLHREGVPLLGDHQPQRSRRCDADQRKHRRPEPRWDRR